MASTETNHPVASSQLVSHVVTNAYLLVPLSTHDPCATNVSPSAANACQSSMHLLSSRASPTTEEPSTR